MNTEIPGERGAVIRLTAHPCRHCGDRRRYVSKHCVGCSLRKSAEQAKRAFHGHREHRDWAAIEAKLTALGRCACGLLNPCERCLPKSAADLAEQRTGLGDIWPEGLA